VDWVVPYLDPKKYTEPTTLETSSATLHPVLVGERDCEMDWLVTYLDPEKFTDTTTSEPDPQHYSLCSCSREGS
jgi:hypothetical protein